MNNLGTENLYTDIQAMGLPVRYIKKKQPVKNTVKAPKNFVSTNPVISKKIPSHTNIQQPVIEQPYNLNKEKQSGAMTETYIPSDEIRKALYAQKQNKYTASKNINAERKFKETSKTVPVANNEFTDDNIIAALFVIGICMGIIEVASYIDFERKENLKQLVAEYEAEHPSALDIATTEWRDLAITDKIKEEIAQYDDEMAIIYNLYETGVEYAQQLRDFWNKETNAYKQMFSSKTEAYNKELHEAMTPTTRKKKAYKKKNPNKKKHDNFCLAGGRLPERLVPKKTDYKPALRQMRAMFNNAQSNIRAYYNPEDHIR
ncbi:MAG: hypothetical protein IKM94_04770 [Alphaproteobacteria bacterium]|nr:hypothetical protein [Alphaproteobacteria bacterium]